MADRQQEELSIEDRRNAIIKLLSERGKVKVADLSKLFGISEVTIRNDLSELEETGLLERVHGGAVNTNRAYYSMSLHERMRTNEEAKKKIAAACAAVVSDGDTIMLNSGTTTFYAARELRKKRNLTIVTNSALIAQEMSLGHNACIILLGGNYNPQYQFAFGDDTIAQLRKYKADKLILSVDGIIAEEGVSTYHHMECEVSRQMISRSSRTIVVTDYTKIGRISFSNIESIDRIDMLITNSGADPEEINAIKEKGIEIKLV